MARRTISNRLKRQQAKRQAVFLVLGCLAVVLLVFTVFALTGPPTSPEGPSLAVDTEVAGEEISATEEAAPAGSVSLGLGGDVTFGLEVAYFLQQNGVDYPWGEIRDLLGSYDHVVVNLEGPLCRGQGEGARTACLPVRGDVACAAPMAEAGVDAVCLANDHAMDYGPSGLEEALSVLRGAGLAYCGVGPSLQEAERPLLLQGPSGGRVAVLSFCDVAPASSVAGAATPGVAAADPQRMEEAIRAARQEADYVVTLLHWGELWSSEVTDRQRELARVCAEAGADLVVGNHPHVVQGVEMISGTPVFYSLGNLVYHSQNEEGRKGIFLGCTFSHGALTGLVINPIEINDARPDLPRTDRAEAFLRELAASSPGVRLEMRREAGTAVLRLETGR